MNVGSFLLGFFSAIALSLVSRQVGDSLPWIARKIIQRAVRTLPAQDRDRLSEEWLDQVGTLPGGLVQLSYGFICRYRAARLDAKPISLTTLRNVLYLIAFIAYVKTAARDYVRNPVGWKQLKRRWLLLKIFIDQTVAMVLKDPNAPQPLRDLIKELDPTGKAIAELDKLQDTVNKKRANG